MIATKELIDTLIKDVQIGCEIAKKHWLTATTEERSWKDPYHGWSIDEVMEHLVAFASRYLGTIEQKILEGQQKGLSPQAVFYYTPELKSFFNNLSYEGLGKMAQLGHFAQIDLTGDLTYDKPTDFLSIQQELIRLLELARTVDLENIHLPALIRPDTTFKLGDCFQFLVRHQILHFAQAEAIMLEYSKSLSLPHS